MTIIFHSNPLPHCAQIAAQTIFRIVPRALLFLYFATFALVGGADVGGAPGAGQPRGLPYIRTYPLAEIGSVPRGARIGVDALGRIAVMYDGIYSVLNDTNWLDRIDPASPLRNQMTTIRVVNGTYYYGGRGSWGTITMTREGRFRAAPLVPEGAPGWTEVTPFNNILGTSSAVYFYELNGVVCWKFEEKQNVFFPVPRLSSVFGVGERVFASTHDATLLELNPSSGTTTLTKIPGLVGDLVEHAAPIDGSHTLLALKSGHLVVFDGASASPWLPDPAGSITGKITGMERLLDGGVALAVEGKGLYLFSGDGSLRWSLQLPEFQPVSAMLAAEPGVLWVMSSNSLSRILYDSPLTGFGEQLGVTALWPEVSPWNNSFAIRSNHTLSVMDPLVPGYPASFHRLLDPAAFEAEHMAVGGPHLLVGTQREVLEVATDGRATPLIRIDNIAGMEFISPDTCIILGSDEIAALQYTGGRWVECAPRISGVGDASVIVQRHVALWVELGGHELARITLNEGTIQKSRIVLPWTAAGWTNVGAVGSTIIISGAPGQRCYFDDVSAHFCEAPRLDRLLERSPYWISRVTEDDSGILWATYSHGVVTFTPLDGDYAVDFSTFELQNDSYPRVFNFPGDNTWITAARAIYHVERGAVPKQAEPRATLVSFFADQQQRELLDQAGQLHSKPRFAFDSNSVGFSFFSGTYSWRSPPVYEYRLASPEPWTPIDASLILRFPKLRDGGYRLEVRRAGPQEPHRLPFALEFTIRPPWYRTSWSYAGCIVLALGALVGIARWMNYRSLHRTAALERVVQQRTSELGVAMEKLAEETKNAATLAERSRLAGEIHDSIQQGLSGALLHLNTTITHPSLLPDVRGQLGVIRNMLSYSREEVQQAVWNLESPLLQNAAISEALQKLATYIHSAGADIQVTASEEGGALEPAVQHNLLRLAQEAITNAVKHSGARKIEVLLRSDAERVVLEVKDNGSGFDPVATSTETSHFGLRGMRSRARAIHAQLEILSSPGAGTTVHVTHFRKP